MPATWLQHGSENLDSAKHAKLVEVTIQPLTAVEARSWSLSVRPRLDALSGLLQTQQSQEAKDNMAGVMLQQE